MNMRAARSLRSIPLSVCLATMLAVGPLAAADTCPGDCNQDCSVTVDEILHCLNLALDPVATPPCAACDPDDTGAVTVDAILRAVTAALSGCIDCEPAPAHIRMEPDQRSGFFSLPWPNDVRVRSTGTIDLTGFPGSEANALARTVLNNGANVTRGFGTNSAVFFQTSAPLDVASLPTGATGQSIDAPALLVNLDDPSDPPAPLLMNYTDAPTLYRPERLLTVLPYPGHPLRGKTRYAAIVFTDLRDADGRTIRPAPLLDALDAEWHPASGTTAERWSALREQRDAVRAYIAEHTERSVGEIAAFSVYTTQDVHRELDAIAAAVRDLPNPAPVSRDVGDCSGDRAEATVVGLLDLPKWQAGAYPYLFSGGGVVIENDRALLQGTERVRFTVTYPCGQAPENGWPILLYMAGTGGSARSEAILELGRAQLPYIVGSVAPLYSGDRKPTGLPAPFDMEEIVFFNYFNTLSARTNQLQQVADMMYLRRIMEGFVLAPEETGTELAVETDDSLIVAVGHSQGALTMPQLLAVDAHFDAGVLSAGGAGLYHTVVHRADIRGLLDPLLGTEPDELDMFHPIGHAVQTLAEIGDAANYAPRVQHAHVVSIAGLTDGCSPIEVTTLLGIAMSLDVANPLWFPAFGEASLEPPAVELPVAGNLPDGRTGVTVQLHTGHFGARTNPDIALSFVRSLAEDGIPTVAPGPLRGDSVPGCAGRHGPVPNGAG